MYLVIFSANISLIFMQKRIEVQFIGNVQGVGFRYAINSIARQFAVFGQIKNLANRNVELIAEGEESELKSFLQEIRNEMEDYIRNEQASWPDPIGNFSDFRIVF